MSWVDSSRERDIQLLGSVYRKAKDSLDRWEPIPLELTVEELDLSVRSFNCLKRANINAGRVLRA